MTTEIKNIWTIEDQSYAIDAQDNGSFGISFWDESGDSDKPLSSFSVDTFKTRESALEGILEILEGREFEGAFFEDGSVVSGFVKE